MWNPTSDLADFCRSQEMTTTMTRTMDDLNVLRTARMHRVVNKLKSVSVSSVVKLVQFVCYHTKIKQKSILLAVYFTECCSFVVQISGNIVTATVLICQQRAKWMCWQAFANGISMGDTGDMSFTRTGSVYLPGSGLLCTVRMLFIFCMYNRLVLICDWQFFRVLIVLVGHHKKPAKPVEKLLQQSLEVSLWKPLANLVYSEVLHLFFDAVTCMSMILQLQYSHLFTGSNLLWLVKPPQYIILFS